MSRFSPILRPLLVLCGTAALAAPLLWEMNSLSSLIASRLYDPAAGDLRIFSAPNASAPPVLLAELSGGAIRKTQPIRYAEIPRHLKDALLSVEDKRFYDHRGVDPLRIVKAAWVNFREGRKEQGGSTITMQLARNLFLHADKTWSRKLQEFAIALLLETRLSKHEILEHYANRVYLGRRDMQPLHGFGQAAETYFDKPLSAINLPEAALLAAIVQRPSYFDPARHPARALHRRNLVLSLMERSGTITPAQRAEAAIQPIRLAPARNDQPDLQWFLELALEDAQRHSASTSGNLYTTLDPFLQQAATDAVRATLPRIDRLTAGKNTVEIALVALDSHTGAVKALLGGRDFATNQFNHATAMRQPGSVFKPFVYAAALASERKVFTPATILNDAPALFRFRGENYEPTNFGGGYSGPVPMRVALARSLNIPAVSLAEQVGYEQVRLLARRSGFNDQIAATPALALGAYEATPLELAGAYTLFANQGRVLTPTFLHKITADSGVPVLTPAQAFIAQDLLLEVMRTGTGSRAHWQYGLTAPAAGKTGTSRDGWFAGYVSNLICVVWVGFDDNSDLNMEGAKSALPIWSEFMKRAAKRPEYRQNIAPAHPPPGVSTIAIDADTGLPAGATCPHIRYEYFLRGTEPHGQCSHESGLAETANH